jgi:fructoselysine-6-P-deglycase FrlB-like protein
MNQLMAAEIAAQAEILPQCVEPIAKRIAAIAPPTARILAAGCGDSAIAPAALGEVFAALGIEIAVCTSMALAGFTRLKKTDTVILSSISGGTRRTVEAAQTARANGARVIALTCRSGSLLDRAADETIVLPYSPLSRSTPHTLDYTVTLLALTQLALEWSGRSAIEVGPVLEVLPRSLDAARRRAQEIALRVTTEGKLFILGAGPELASAEYCAAKFHEAGGLIAIAAETENFVHGMNFMVEPADAILALGGNAPGLRRGREITDSFRDFVAAAEVIVPEAVAGEGWRRAFGGLLSTTFVLQQLCLAVADRKALAVEQPRAGRVNGARSLAIQSRILTT